MYQVLRSIALMFFVSCCVNPAAGASTIPIESFAKHSKYRDAVISPTGEYLAVSLVLESGDNALAVLRLSDYEWLINVKFDAGVMPYNIQWANDERIIVQRAREYLGDNVPYSNGTLFAMNFDGTKQAQLVATKDLRGLLTTDQLNNLAGFARPVHMLPEDDRHILIHFYSWRRSNSKDLTDLYRLNIYTGKATQLIKSPSEHGWFLLDDKAKPTTVFGYRGYKEEVFHKREGKKWVELEEFAHQTEDTEWKPIASVANGSELLLREESAGETDKLIQYNPTTEERTVLFQHDKADFGYVALDRDTNKPYALFTDYLHPEITLLDPSHPIGRWYPALQKAFSGQQIGVTSATSDYGVLVIRAYSDTKTDSYFLFHTTTKKFQKVFDSTPWLADAVLAPKTPYEFVNRDNIAITGYFTAPTSGDAKPPLVVIPHGGPHARDYWHYDAQVQFLASRGYAVLQVNFQGSTGFGDKFHEAGRKRWGDLIQNDIIDATKWLVSQGVADKDRICILGASFGGYSALMAPTIEPDLFKCAIGYVGVYDLQLMWEYGDIQDHRWGDDILEDIIGSDEEQLTAFSPINHIDKLKAPVLLIHGKKDRRAHVAHYDAMKKALEKAGHPTETFLAKDEAHGFRSVKNRVKLYTLLEAFLDKHIGK